MSTRILLADDHDVVRAGLRLILEKLEQVEIVGEAVDGRAACELARTACPHIALLDITMPGLNGLEAARRLRVDVPAVKVIMLSMHMEARMVLEALKAGARGYLVKSQVLQELPTALRAVTAGKMFLSPSIQSVVVEDYLRRTPSDDAGSAGELSAREREVLQLLAEGKTSKEIGSLLHVSPKTIETHRVTIMSKLGIRTVAQLTKFAIREGITSLD